MTSQPVSSRVDSASVSDISTVEPATSVDSVSVNKPSVNDSVPVNSGTEPSNSELLRDRYGKNTGRTKPQRTPRNSRFRWRVWLYTALAIAVGCLIAWVGYKNLGSAPIDAERVGFVEKSDTSIEITFRVTRDDQARAGVCIVRARDLTGAENGRKEVLIPAGGSAVVTTIIKTTGKPVTADTYGCSYSVPSYLSSSSRPTG